MKTVYQEIPIAISIDAYGPLHNPSIGSTIHEICGVPIDEHTTVRQIVNAIREKLEMDNNDYQDEYDAVREILRERRIA